MMARKQKVQGNHRRLLVAYRLLLLMLVLAFVWQPVVAAQQSPLAMQLVVKVPAKVWASVERAQGVTVGGQPGTPLRVQVVFDPDCPYCALLYEYMKREYPQVAVRWVPIAFLLPDSSARAGAILASSNPAASLDQDFTHYDFNGLGSHGGYAIPKGKHYTLPAVNAELQRAWEYKWGGATPTVLIRNQDGTITRVLGFQTDVINRLLPKRSELPAYQN